MRKIEEEISTDNFLDKCANNSLGDGSCIMGIIILLISFIPLFFNIYAFAKMTMFYKKLNFENSIILISAIEIFILEFALTTSLDIFLQFFFFMQIMSISLLLKKFSNIFKHLKSIFKNNVFFISINAINLIIFILYIVLMVISEEKSFIINLIYKIFYLIATCLLSYSCIFMNKLIAQHKKEYIENYNSSFDPSILLIESKEYSDLGILTNEGSNSSSENKDNDKDNNMQRVKSQKGEVFYHIKRRQNKCLYLINLICSIIELCFTLIRFFILKDDFLEHKYKILPLTIPTEILYYFYLLVCLVNVSVIFFCFYYYIRRQYSIDPTVFKKRASNKIIDDAFIEEQKKQDDNLEMNEGIVTQNKIRRKKSSLDVFNDIVLSKDIGKE